MMRSLMKAPIAAFVLGGTLFTGCGDDSLDPDYGYYDGSIVGSVPDSAVGTDGGSSTGDSGSTVVFDAAQSQPDGATAADAAQGSDASSSDAATGSDGSAQPDAGEMGVGECCDDGDCLCHGPKPTALTSARGPYKTANYTVTGAGCVFYPTDAEPPFAAVTISDGFLGAGGCNSFQTGQWAPLYASWGIVAMIVDTGAQSSPEQRGTALAEGIAALKAENTKSGSKLFNKLAGRYGTSGFSMGGGGTSHATRADKTLLSSVAIMPYGTARSGITTPTLVICGSSDGTAPCSAHGTPLYNGIGSTISKMRVEVQAGHNGQPSAAGGKSGEYGLAFTKLFLEGDERWRPLLVNAQSQASTIK